MVVAPGVAISASSAHGAVDGAGLPKVAASRLAAKPQESQISSVSSPIGVRYTNSWARLPPIMPTSDRTAATGSPQRRKMVRYAWYCARYRAARPAASTSKLYASFMTNSRTRIRPARGRGSSRNFVWSWNTIRGRWR